MDKVIIEYRDQPPADPPPKVGFVNWKESKAGWSADDVRFLNKVCGYQKYRARSIPT